MSTPQRTSVPVSTAAKENSTWDIYNKLADARDEDLIKDWRNSLNSLLVFAAIFAAVLTALVVESMKMLNEDPQDVTAAVLLRISTQLANDSTPAWQSAEFEAPRYAVVVNSLLFVSLCCSLVAALAGVVALQWVNEYDASTRLGADNAQKRAVMRHSQYLGIEKWKVGRIIALLPLLIHVSVFLFFAGIVEWTRNLNSTIYYICVAGFASIVGFNIATAILGKVFSDAPFRSPVERALAVALGLPLAFLKKAMMIVWPFLYICVSPLVLLLVGVLGGTSPPTGAIRTYYLLLHLKDLTNHLFVSVDAGTRKLLAALVPLPTNGDAPMELYVAMWTATHVDISQEHLYRLASTLEQVLSLLRAGKVSPKPWRKALNEIAGAYLNSSFSRNPSDADSAVIRIFVKIWTSFGHSPWSREMFNDIKTSSWSRLDPIMKLIGPLDFEGTLNELDMMLVIKLIQINVFSGGTGLLQQLKDVSKDLFESSTSPSPHVVRYAISSLSTYLWTKGTTELSKEVTDVLARLTTTCPPAADLEISLISSALHAAVFGLSDGARQFWGSRHSIVDADSLGDNFESIQAIHSSMTRYFSAAAARESSPVRILAHLRNMSLYLAYTPTTSPPDGGVQHAKEFLEDALDYFVIPLAGNLNSLQLPPHIGALSCPIWISKIAEIPGIYEYLEVLLSARKNFPFAGPMWRDCYNPRMMHAMGTGMGLREAEITWLLTLPEDRRLVELLLAFDQLVAGGCSAKQHLVLVRLAVDDLSSDRKTLPPSPLYYEVFYDLRLLMYLIFLNPLGLILSAIPPTGEYLGYYTTERLQQIGGLNDPPLRLLGAWASATPYSGHIPHQNDQLWKEEAWLEAMEFWCANYKKSDTSIDGLLIGGALLQPNERLASVVMEASSKNLPLQNQIFTLLETAMSENVDAGGALLLHAIVCSAPWFLEYSTSTNAMNTLLQLAPAAGSLDLRVITLLSSFLRSIDRPQQLEVILTSLKTILDLNDEYPSQTDVDVLSAALETMLQVTPDWLMPTKGANEDLWEKLLHDINYILLTLRVLENGPAAMLRRTGRIPAVLHTAGRDGHQSRSCSVAWCI